MPATIDPPLSDDRKAQACASAFGSLADALLHAGSNPAHCSCRACVMDRTERYSVWARVGCLLAGELYDAESIARVVSRLRCGASVETLISEGLVDESDREAIEEILQ
jgi:hypothetical protein